MKNFLIIIFLNIVIISISAELVKDDWVIEWGKFEGVNLSLSNQLLLTSIPTYFMENFDSDYNHYPDTEERLLVFYDLKNIKKRELRLSRLNYIKAKDKLLFNNGTQSQLEAAIKKIEGVQKELDDLNILEFKIDVFENVFKNNFLPEDGKEFTLLKEHEIAPYMERENIDYYISGVIEEDFNNLFVTVKLYSKYSDNKKVIWTGIGDNEEILGYRSEILHKLSRIIISKDIISYSVDVTPKNALIYIDDSFKGLGVYKGYTINSKNLSIDILKEGYHSLSLDEEITSDNNDLFIELIPIESETIVVTSKPNGASVYYGSRYIGITPIEIPIYSFSQNLTISHEGYMDKSVVIDNISRNMHIVLTEGVFDREENFVTEKRNFYTATAIFSISLGAPLYFTAVDGNIDEIIMNVAIGNAVFWGLNLFYRLYCYLRAAEISVE